MKQILGLFIAITFISSCNNDKKETPVTDKPATPAIVIDSTLITDSSWGLVTAKTDFAGLQSIFGATNVKDERVCGPECADSINVTILFEETPKKATVYWSDDSNYHKKIGYIEAWEVESPYHTAAGIKLGSSLNQIVKLNGKKITFSGFDWDYGGLIQSYNGGALEKSSIHYSLGLFVEGFNDLSGDMELNTDMPGVKKALEQIKVTTLSLTLSKSE
jgi:hypothetical protein